jgi:hypothetical protein
MPHHEIHKKKKAKNYALLIVLCLLIATFFTVTMVKLKIAGENARIEKQQKQ